MDNKQALLNLLGLARRARKTVFGEDQLLQAVRQNKIDFLFIASDTGKATAKKFNDKSKYYHVDTNSMYTKEELSNAIGIKRTMVGINDKGFAKKMVELTNKIKGE
ncbi:ribosomal L7Ae/L30e/S12e/Gadd45 family protein [Lentilactobacillus sp. Marseille-Q4993]|uniref:L7Ae/L30e/S12e/Gadd45 family ribosomal protein n=1 Tax=Lentilactobacillus sp. Marseille-Q4993 TaxID=3039492 RepID=UPI0024BD24C5|nr:ribosomal L7Ae/L30e/S12e/Gadd45 family protein [Lentilactobacillus sp. Marseille-Q4993]